MPDESQDTPVLDTIAAMTAVSLAECDLAPDALVLVRPRPSRPSMPALSPISSTSDRRPKRG